MKMTAEYLPRPGCLYVWLGGVISLRQAMQVLADIHLVAAENHLTKALIDVNSVQGTLSTMDSYNFGKYCADLRHRDRVGRVDGGLAPLRYAFLGCPPVIDPRCFTQVVARQRGVHMLSTISEREAIEFLEIPSADAHNGAVVNRRVGGGEDGYHA